MRSSYRTFHSTFSQINIYDFSLRLAVSSCVSVIAYDSCGFLSVESGEISLLMMRLRQTGNAESAAMGFDTTHTHGAVSNLFPHHFLIMHGMLQTSESKSVTTFVYRGAGAVDCLVQELTGRFIM